MYMVYWTEVQNNKKTPHQQEFETTAMAAALKFMEELRARQRVGEGICFVTMQSEHPDSVGNPGAVDPSPYYNWMKRRRQ